MGFIGNNPNKPKINLLRNKRSTFSKADFENEFTFQYKTKKGATLKGYLHRRPGQRSISIEDINTVKAGKEHLMGDHKQIAGKAAGPRDIRGALGELRKRFPEARKVAGARLTGLRHKGSAGLVQELKIKPHKKKPMTLRQARTRRKMGSEIQKAFRLKGLGRLVPMLAPLDAISIIKDWKKAIHKNMLKATGGQDA